MENIILDLGGVVIRLASEEQWRTSLSEVLDFEKYYHRREEIIEFLKAFECGTISNEEFLEVLYSYRKSDTVTTPNIITAWNAILRDYHPQTIQKLYKLKDRHRLFLLSNTNSIHEQAFIKIAVEQYGNYILEDIFDKIYLSHNMGYRKPEFEAYTMILEDNKLIPSETIFVDDKLENIEAAKKLGIDARLHPFNQYIGKSIR